MATDMTGVVSAERDTVPTSIIRDLARSVAPGFAFISVISTAVANAPSGANTKRSNIDAEYAGRGSVSMEIPRSDVGSVARASAHMGNTKTGVVSVALDAVPMDATREPAETVVRGSANTKIGSMHADNVVPGFAFIISGGIAAPSAATTAHTGDADISVGAARHVPTRRKCVEPAWYNERWS